MTGDVYLSSWPKEKDEHPSLTDLPTFAKARVDRSVGTSLKGKRQEDEPSTPVNGNGWVGVSV